MARGTILDKELQKIIKTGEVGKRYADKLVKVWPKIDNGPGDVENSRALGSTGSSRSPKDLLLHIEVQGYREKNFAQRIFIYHYKIFEKYKIRVLSMVILTDTDPRFRPNKYVDKSFGYGIELEWKLIKLIDYRGREAELTQSTEPFALVVLAFLEYSKTKGDTRKKYAAKKKLIELLVDKDLGERRSQGMLRFIDWTLQLPEEWEKRPEEEQVRMLQVGSEGLQNLPEKKAKK